MEQVFIIEGKRIKVKIKWLRVENMLLDITSVGKVWQEIIPAGRKIEFDGMTEDGKRISGMYRIISSPEEGVLELEPWDDIGYVGKGG